MALTGKNETRKIGESEVPTFIAEFTNGTLAQLDDIADFLTKEGFEIPTEDEEKKLAVLKMGIGWLERLKEQNSNKEKI